ncbi:MAG: ATP-binding protein, partial [Fidelibacterota bacterium]
EMNGDLKRLSKVAYRFSQIGSGASLKPERLSTIIDRVINYFNKRLPHTRKDIVIKKSFEVDPVIPVNSELFEWVIENLIKNSVDAIESEKGLIEITISESKGKDKYFIDIKDNGKGIETRKRKDIFKPGYSTKMRGWGLGLSLSKRIIEDYHGGKLTLKESKVGQGSIMRITLENRKRGK